MKCKSAREEEQLQRRLEDKKTHNPEDRHVKTEGELRALGAYAKRRDTEDTDTTSAPEKKEYKKSTRVCGKCGQSGHNARTCGRTKRFGLRMPGEEAPKRNEDSFAVDGKVGAPKRKKAKASTRAASMRSKARQNTCGKCGGKGHNARTCKKEKR